MSVVHHFDVAIEVKDVVELDRRRMVALVLDDKPLLVGIGRADPEAGNVIVVGVEIAELAAARRAHEDVLIRYVVGIQLGKAVRQLVVVLYCEPIQRRPDDP